MRRVFEIGGAIAGVVLLGFGIAVIVLALNGRSTVRHELSQQNIVGSSDMTPQAIKAEAAKAGLTNVDLPTCSVAAKTVKDGTRARCFAQYMRIHALEASGGLTYSQLPRYATADGKGTNDPNAASKGPNGQPLDNPTRDLWVTETALSTALNTSYMAEHCRFSASSSESPCCSPESDSWCSSGPEHCDVGADASEAFGSLQGAQQLILSQIDPTAAVWSERTDTARGDTTVAGPPAPGLTVSRCSRGLPA